MEKDLRNQIEAIKGSKISEKEKQRLITLARQEASKERKIQRMSKEGKLRAICADYIGMAVDFAISLSEAGKAKISGGWFVKDLKKRLRSELTVRLKQVKVLPLGV
jgi:hypothetical protein